MLTLVIAALASVVAAVVVSHVWQSGTLWATAMTPVIVALVKETLERPAQKITEVGVVPRRHRPDELVVEEIEPSTDPAAPPRPAGYSVYGLQRKHWKLALLTGLLAFVIAAAALTLPELVAGRSVVSGGKKTTLLGGHRHPRKATPKQTTETVTTTVPSNTQTTTTPGQTSPTTPQDTTTTPPPGQTTPTTPQNTTTAPPAQTTPTVPPAG